MIWLHGNESFLELFNYVNSYHTEIRYTWEWSKSRLPFYDVMVKLEDNKISTDLNSKTAYTRKYLNNGSCNPKDVK